jgi:gentisate 1,2-dioxygenase
MATRPPETVDDEAYYRRLHDLNVEAYWKMNLAAQVVGALPYVWHWKDLYPALADSVELVELERGGAERRVITMANPGRKPLHTATHTLQCSLQMILPGEVAPAHRHSFAAFRFIITGSGAYTVVDGEKCPMQAGDLILTPGWTWHDHGNEGSHPMVWLDGLDVPLVGALRAMFYEDFPGRVAQPVEHDYPEKPLIYKWEDACEALKAAPEDERHGRLLEYSPAAGGHLMPTLACYLQAVSPGFRTGRRRETPSSVYFVVRGSGRSLVGDQELAWEQNDIIAVPNWTWVEHEAGAGEEAILFSFSDRPALERLELIREEWA